MKPDKIKTLSKVFGTILCISLISAFLLYLLSGNYKDYTDVSSTGSLVNAEDTVCFTDVGQGDCTLIYSRGRTALIDTGTPESAHKLCKSLRSKGIKTIDALIITHFHDDHYGGANEIAEMFEIKNLIMPDMAKTDENIADVTELKKSVLAEDNEVYVARKGMNFSIGNFNLTIVGYFLIYPRKMTGRYVSWRKTRAKEFFSRATLPPLSRKDCKMTELTLTAIFLKSVTTAAALPPLKISFPQPLPTMRLSPAERIIFTAIRISFFLKD